MGGTGHDTMRWTTTGMSTTAGRSGASVVSGPGAPGKRTYHSKLT